MPKDLLEQMYCSQQINIPPNLPFILKQYAKAAIRTQPHDLLFWSAAYFRAKANNSPPPVKERLEYPPVDTPSRLSPGFLKVLHKQLGESEEVAAEVLYEKWLGVCLVKEALDGMLKVGEMTNKVQWLEFVAIAAGHLCPSLSKTMAMVCEVLTEEPDGGSAMVPVDVFVTLYQFLARLDCGPRNPNNGLAHVESSTTVASLLESHSSDRSEIQQPMLQKDLLEPCEKDSTAGLMVWQDVKPPETQDTVRSPHHTDEPGASSDLGLEVLDNATGPVQEVLTLYPAQDPVQSEKSFPSQLSSSHHLSVTEETVLSHSSLKENEDWIKVESRKIEDEMIQKEDEDLADVTDGLVKDQEQESIQENDGSETLLEGEETSEDLAERKVKLDEAAKEITVDEEGEEELETSEKDSDNETAIQKSRTVSFRVKIDSKSVAEPTKDVNESTQSTLAADTNGIQSFEKNVSAMVEPSRDSLLELGESVTVERFIRDDLNGSTITYSTGEIRKGIFGHESHEKIERDSSERVIKAAETVHSLKSLEEESSVLLPAVKLSSEEFSSQGSQSFMVLEEFWQEVPGIGPVVPEPQILAVVEYMNYWAGKQEGMVMPRNIHHILCPPLDTLPPTDQDVESHY